MLLHITAHLSASMSDSSSVTPYMLVHIEVYPLESEKIKRKLLTKSAPFFNKKSQIHLIFIKAGITSNI